ncbi:carboxylesterase family protein [Streptomyces sp. NPDC101455]|uniref:carboxylesterase family protein n=1 Tax=Streptomyces sp. NPDC101455 TaxID=3366142 RepID=UPI0038144297
MNRRTFLTGPLRIDTGRVSGVASLISGVTVFKGLPYAETTAGANRWRPPRPATSWTGVRFAATGSASSPSPTRPRWTSPSVSTRARTPGEASVGWERGGERGRRSGGTSGKYPLRSTRAKRMR